MYFWGCFVSSSNNISSDISSDWSYLSGLSQDSTDNSSVGASSSDSDPFENSWDIVSPASSQSS